MGDLNIGADMITQKIFKEDYLKHQQMNRLLIVGVDPGTTMGYSVIDTSGNIIKLRSSKLLNLNKLISEVVEIGRVIIVGTDKAKVPATVEAFSTKTGAKLIRPKEDMKVYLKKELIDGVKTRNDHESDSLAAAIFAYNQVEALLKKIDNYVKSNKKEHIKDKIIEIVITRNISISNACEIIEKPDKEEIKIIKKIVTEKEIDKEDFLRLYNKLRRAERENMFLRKQNNNLKKELRDSRKNHNKILQKIEMIKPEKEAKKILKYKEGRILSFDRKVKSKEKDISRIKYEVDKLKIFLSRLNDNYLIKKLDNLGKAEFEKKESLNISLGDILYVKDPNIFNNKIIENLKANVTIIIHEKKLAGACARLPFIFISSKNIKIEENNDFALVRRDTLDKEVEKKRILEKVLEEYKSQRSV